MQLATCRAFGIRWLGAADWCQYPERLCPKSLVLPGPRSGRVKVAQHFSAGNRSATSPSPCNGRLINPRLGKVLRIQPSVSRTVACDRADPTDKSVIIYLTHSPTFT